MVVKILSFGIAKDIIGKQAVKLNVSNAATAASLKKLLVSRYPELSTLPNFMIAINSRYAEESVCLKPDDEIAIIPPTNGG